MTDRTGLIEKEFVVLSADKEASIERFDSTLYERLDENYPGFKGCELISCHEFSSDWPTWEIHPHGDEIVILLSGEVTFILQLEAGDEAVILDREGSYIIVPKNVWHTARTERNAKLLFITPGEGTENRSV